MKQYKFKPLMSVEDSDALEGQMVKADDVKALFSTDVDIFDKESGKCLAKFRKGVIPPELCVAAYENLLGAASLTDSRATAAAGKGTDGNASTRRIRKDGSISRQNISRGGVKINSGVAGYFDRMGRPGMQHCRLTAFTKHHFDKFVNAYPIVKFVDTMYAKLMPKEYKLQRTLADKTSQDFVIPQTSFTTITVNKNYRTAIHKDAGDFKDGFGNLTALREGNYEGAYLTLPRWGCGFDLQNGDLLLMDVHQWHGNTPMIKIDKHATRLSLVMYYREGMKHCGTMKQELNRVKNRKKGDPLNG